MEQNGSLSALFLTDEGSERKKKGGERGALINNAAKRKRRKDFERNGGRGMGGKDLEGNSGK